NGEASSLGAVLEDTLRKTEEVLRREKPDAFLVLGDTNSAISAIMAKRMHVPVYHMEAGNRCFDENVPEETNRRLVDHVADFTLFYPENARGNLLAEGLLHRAIFFTDSHFAEVLATIGPQIVGREVFCALADSGSTSEESSILRFPAVTLRSSSERPEALDTSSIIMTDLRPAGVIAGVEAARADYLTASSPREYDISDCSVRVRNFILSTAYEHAVWAGLR